MKLLARFNKYLSQVFACLFSIGLVNLFLFANGANAQSLIRDAEIEKLIRDYSNPIFTAAGLNPNDIQIYIVGDKSLNAFVTDGQKMFLHTGIILEAKTPNQLKGVIAHETGHIAGGHLARSVQGERAAMVPAFISMALGVIAMAAGAPDAGAALMASSQQFAILNFFVYTRIQESSADQAAFEYLEKTNQSPQGLIDFFEKFRYVEIMSEARREPYFRSHPLSSDRISSLENRIKREKFEVKPDSAEDIEKLKLIQAKIFAFVYPSNLTYSKYPANPPTQEALYARAIAFYRAPEIDLATQTVEKLLKLAPNNPYYNELMGQIYFENQKSDKAAPFYKRSIELAPNESLLRVGYARTLINLGTKDDLIEAEAQLRAAIRLEADNAFAWNQLAIVADKQGKTGLARLATAEEAFALGDFFRANRFSQVAMKNLEKATPNWQRAADIRSITDEIVVKQMKKGKQY